MPISLRPCLGLVLALPALLGAVERRETDLSAWRFHLGDGSAEAATAGWSTVALPHTWNDQDGQPVLGGLPEGPHPQPYRGVGWYGLTMAADPAWQGRRVFLRFGAASLVSQVYVNGRQVGAHRGGFTAFTVEIGDHLAWDRPNEVRVRVDNAVQPDVAPLGGDFNISGGLYRPVRLLVTEAVCIADLADGGSGLAVRTDALSEAQADLRVAVHVAGSPAPGSEVQVRILDREGRTVGQAQAPLPGPGVQELSVTVPSPHLWNGIPDPYLYRCQAALVRGGAEFDRVEDEIGIRTVAITDQAGFLLNGRPYPIHGVNRHQELPGRGWAMRPGEMQRDIDLICEMGATAVRCSHYPQGEEFTRLCDRAGLLVWQEVPLVARSADTPEFAGNAGRQTREMVVQLGNHPAVGFWGLFNELKAGKPWQAPLLAGLKEIVCSLDPDRPVVGATNQAPDPMHQVPDWTCWNMYPGWYGGKAGELGRKLDPCVQEIGRRVGISEYGAGGNPWQHAEDETAAPAPKGAVHPEEYQAYFHERSWASIADHPRLWGSFIWVMFDFASTGRTEGGYAGLNDKGLVTADRAIRKDAFWFYKANWTQGPLVHLCGKRFTVRTQTRVAIKAYSTVGALTLTVNGTAVGGPVEPDAIHVCRWPAVDLAPGANHLVVTGRSQGTEIADQGDLQVMPTPGAKP